jgi:hypothetical protein
MPTTGSSVSQGSQGFKAARIAAWSLGAVIVILSLVPVASSVFRTLDWAEQRPALAQAVMAPVICWSFSSRMFRYLLLDQAVPAMWRGSVHRTHEGRWSPRPLPSQGPRRRCRQHHPHRRRPQPPTRPGLAQSSLSPNRARASAGFRNPLSTQIGFLTGRRLHVADQIMPAWPLKRLRWHR